MRQDCKDPNVIRKDIHRHSISSLQHMHAHTAKEITLGNGLSALCRVDEEKVKRKIIQSIELYSCVK